MEQSTQSGSDRPAAGGDEQHGTRVELRDLTLRAGERTLLENVHAEFLPGQITLIIGPSGAGKSLLLRLIAGLMDTRDGSVTSSGTVQIGENNGWAGATNIGVVFQQFALFDELSPAENVRFAFAHRKPAGKSAGQSLQPGRLLRELNVPTRVRTASLSGGQRQRLAIARTLANNPDVILYDEPTSGLDAATAAQVARLIQSTHASHPKTSVIVTHDYASLLPIADQVYLLDPPSRALRSIDRSQWPQLQLLLTAGPPAGSAGSIEAAGSTASAGGKAGAWFGAAWRVLGGCLEATSRGLEQALMIPLRLLPLWRSVPWGLRFLLHYLRLVAGPSAWLYVGAAGGIIAFVATYFTFRFLPYRPYTEPLVIENLLHGLGFSLYRILVPVLITVLIAARCGAAVASDVGAKVYGSQIDAMRSLNAPPGPYLITAILHAFLLGTPLLVGLAFLAARFVSLLVFTSTHPDYGPYFWQTHFHRELIVPGSAVYQGSGWLIAKLLMCAAGTAVIAYSFGARPKHSGRDVSAGITATILWATLFVLAVHCAFAFYEFPATR